MKRKWLLYAGLIILGVGILLNILVSDSWWPLVIIISGITMKVYYIFSNISKRNYHPGSEILFLIVGLILFFSGIYLASTVSAETAYPAVLKGLGISLKVVFVVLFLRKSKTV